MAEEQVGRQGRPGGKRGRRLRFAAATTALLALAGYGALQLRSADEGPYRCEVRAGADQEPYELEPQMIRNAATIEAVGTGRGLPERAVTIALATAMQESMLRNLDHGDRDSVGLFQQRPSQGWGTVEEIMDPVYAAGKFYEKLEEIPDYADLALTDAAQRVQLSGHPLEYAKHETHADLLAGALTGRRPAVLNCRGERSGEPMRGEAAKVRAKLEREYGAEVLPAGGTGAGRSARAGTLVIPVPAPGDGKGSADEGAPDKDSPGDESRRGWRLAHWALANASHLGVERIAYDGRVWDAGESARGWQKTDGVKNSEVRLSLVQ